MPNNLPVPRSKQTILSDMIDTFLSVHGLPGLKAGSGILTTLEAAAQSDARSTQDAFAVLDTKSLDRANGAALDLLGAEENIFRLGAKPSQSYADFTDTSFTKKYTRLYSGAPAPIVGALTLKVADASSFPASGSIYIGRGTVNYEGPLVYGSITTNSGYYTLNLISAITRTHNLNETVILAKGGARTIPSGTAISTTQGAAGGVITFTTLNSITLEDGEVYVSGAQVVCQEAGTVGNVPANSIKQIVGTIFNGNAVNNPLPFTNGQAIETDNAFRERIRATRASRSRGTALALITNALGINSSDEGKSVLSASVSNNGNGSATLFIDDGTGYEENYVGVSLETLTESALGGEDRFKLNAPVPIAKAFVVSTLTAPFNLSAGDTLAVKTGGILQSHSFEESDATALESASAYEVAASINSNSDLLFSARTIENGTKVVLFAKSEDSEDIEIVTPDGNDANDVFGFSTKVNYTLRLYKNDVLLFKDGVKAKISSTVQSEWDSMASGVQLNVTVDQTDEVTYTFTDSDFVNADTGYTTLSESNSLESWAAVFNKKLPGITTTVENGILVLTSNKGADGDSRIELSSPGGSNNLISKGMFDSDNLISEGANNDYQFDRTTGELKLTNALEEEDNLVAGSNYTRAYLQNEEITSGLLTIGSNGATLFLVVDGSAEVLQTGLSGSTTIATTVSSGKVRYTASTAIFGSGSTAYVRQGDYVIIWDTALQVHGVFRITKVDSSFNYFEIERNTSLGIQSATTLNEAGLVFVRSDTPVQMVRLAAGNSITLEALVDDINSQLIGATASVYQNRFIRITSNTYQDGNIILVSADTEGQNLLFPENELATTNDSHLATAPTRNTLFGTPTFSIGTVDLYQSGVSFTFSNNLSYDAGHMLVGLRSLSTYSDIEFGNNKDRIWPVNTYSASYLNPRTDSPEYTINSGGLVRAGTVVTVTTTTAHRFKVGDMVYVWNTGTVDANFAAGEKRVASVPSTTTFTYSEAGSAVSSVQPYAVVLDRLFQESSDLFVATSGYALGSEDKLEAILDADATNRNYSIPMYRNIKPTNSAVYGTGAFGILDVDNGNVAPSQAFGTDNTQIFRDFAVYMKARGKSHNVAGSNLTVLWRYGRYGAEGNNAVVKYTYPEEADSDLIVIPESSDKAYIQVHLPTGPERTGLNLTPNMAFTIAVTAAFTANADKVVFTYSKPSISIGNLNRSGTVVTGVTSSNHGFTSGDVVYITSSDGNFPSGAKTVATVPGATTFTYIENGAAASSASLITVSLSPNDPDFSNVQVDDIVNISEDTGLDTTGIFCVRAKTATSFTVYNTLGESTTQTTPAKINENTNIKFYPVDTAISTTSDIITTINSDYSDIVTGTLIDNGGGNTGADPVTQSTYEEYLGVTINTSGGSSVSEWSLYDGINWVKASSLTGSPNTIQFKAGIETTLTSDSDFLNENMRLVPVTTQNMADWLSNPAVSGFYAGTENISGTNGQSLQITSLTAGSSGAIQIAGGTASATSALVVGTGSIPSGTVYTKLTTLASQAGGLVANRFAALQAGLVQNKTNLWDNTSTIAVAATAEPDQWEVTITGPDDSRIIHKEIEFSVDGADKWKIEKVGNFAIYTLIDTGAATNLTGILEGDWVEFNVDGASPLNSGIKQVVRKTTASSTFPSFWVENEDAVEEVVTMASGDYVNFFSYDSVLPGDTLTINTDAAGSANMGAWEVIDLVQGDETKFIVRGNLVTAGATALSGGKYAQVVVTEAEPIRLIKRIRTILQNPDSSDYVDVIFDTDDLANKINSNNTSTIIMLDKLNFDTGVNVGADAYAYIGGLLGEVGKVIYGDLANPTVYPGVKAAGATVYVSGPTIKRIQVSLAVRLRSGLTDTLEKVQNIVATVINQTPKGQHIALSDLIDAANSVDGVESVVMLSPIYNSENDLIRVQSNEKPRVLDLATDVLVSELGE